MESKSENSKIAIQEANNKTEKRIIHIILRLPQRSPATPNHGDKRLPKNLKAPKAVSIRTESVVVKMYQPKIRASIS